MKELISVIIPVYNIDEKYLSICLESVITQSYTDIEIILVDDGSERKVANFCDSYKLIDNRISVFHLKNGGVARARNYGLANSKGKYILFVDGDDWLERNMIEKLYNELINYNADIALSSYIFKNKDYINLNNKIEYIDDEYLIMQIRKLMLISDENLRWNVNGAPWAKLYKKDILENYNIKFNEELIRSQDNEFNFRLFKYIKKLVYIEEGLYHYRYDENSAVNKYRKDNYKISNIYLKALKNNINKEKDNYRDIYYKVVWSKLIENCTVDYCHLNNKESFIEKLRGIKKMIKSDPYCTVLNSNVSLIGTTNKLLQVIIRLRNEFLIWLVFYMKNYIKKLLYKFRY